MRVAYSLCNLSLDTSIGTGRLRRLMQAACGWALGGLVVLGAGCQSTPDATGPVGGTVTGALDTHCKATSKVQPTNAAACHATLDMSGGTADMGAAVDEPDYGDTLFNAEGDDDDCKYHLKFSFTPIRKSGKVTFTAVVTSLATGQPVTGAAVEPEVFLSETHPAPNSGSSTTESPPGTYTVGPIVFDASGRWTLRYHLFESCTDAAEDSPHGHGAFFIDVP